MNEVEIPVGTGRVVLGPPLLVPVAGTGRFHGHDALRLIFEDPRALGLLRTNWRQLGLDGDPVQQSVADLRGRLEQAIASSRLSAMYIPSRDDSRLDLEWYHTKDANGRRIVPQLGAVQGVDWDPKWTTFDKILKAIDLTIPRLRQAGRDAAANALHALIQPEAVALMVGLFAAWMAAHAYGIGEIADIAVIVLAYQAAGVAGLKAIADIASATRAAGNARSKIDLDRVADRYAAGLVLLGEAFLLALLARIMQKSAGKAREVEGGSAKAPPKPDQPAVTEAAPRSAKPVTPSSTLKPLLDRASVIARQKGLSLEELHALAVENQKTLGEIGTAIARKTGTSFKDPGVKDLARAGEKMLNEGYADASGLKDLSRAAFTVRDKAQADAIVAELRKTYPLYDKGWQQLESGYLDRKLILRSPNGGVSEVQLVPETIWDYKVGDGHALYEVVRTTDDVALAKALREESAAKFAELLKGTPFGKGK